MCVFFRGLISLFACAIAIELRSRLPMLFRNIFRNRSKFPTKSHMTCKLSSKISSSSALLIMTMLFFYFSVSVKEVHDYKE